MAVVFRITLTLYLCSTTIGHHPKTVPPPRIAHPAPYSPAGSVALPKNCGESSNCHSEHQVPHRRYGVEFEKFSKLNRRGKYTRKINRKNVLKYRNTPKLGSPNHHHFSFPILVESEVHSATNSVKPEENITPPKPLKTLTPDKKNDSYHFIFHKITIGKQIPRTVAAMTLVYDPKSQYADLNFSTNETVNPSLKNTSSDQMSSQNHNLVSTSEKELKITSGATDRRRQRPSKRKCKGCRVFRRKIDTLDTFEKQMKFLRRWERRLYRQTL